MTYHMMYTATPASTTKKINRIFKDFLWGFDREIGKRKTPLVAWSWLTQPRECGGLGFKDYMTHSEALLSRWVTRVLEDSSTEWATIFIALSKAFTWEQRKTQNRAQYYYIDQILFGMVKSYRSLPYAASLWRA